MQYKLIIEKDAFTGTLHRLIGFNYQPSGRSLEYYHSLGQDLIPVSETRYEQYFGTDVFSRRENMYVYNSTTNDLGVVVNPDFDPTGGV